MNCANPDCRCGLFDRPGGSIWLMQLEVPHEQLVEDDRGAFTLRPAPTKCFWLCAECSEYFIVQRWTPVGVCLAEKKSSRRSTSIVGGVAAIDLAPFTFHASAQFEEEFLDIG